MPFIEVIDHENSDGALREIYEDLINKRGKLAAVHMIQSLNPDSIVKHMDLYMLIMFGKSPLKRYQREMLGVIVSRTNRCQYCVEHHSVALQHFWKDAEKVKLLIKDFTRAGLDDTDLLLCLLAEQMTLKPHFDSKGELYRRLKAQGVDDRSLLDANLVIAYFNFVNRTVLGLGVESSPDEVGGYNYD
ncbi:peroxidase-related enzyme [bacterium SCSIO 12741]|nr:peroxidase-related enzyme [bacterium SCSIO 12741]